MISRLSFNGYFYLYFLARAKRWKISSLRSNGYTLLELMITTIVLGVLSAIAIPAFSSILAKIRLNIATFELSQQWKVTQLDATGNGETPTTLCMKEVGTGQVQYAQIMGNNCQSATQWQSLSQGVSIDVANSTLRTVARMAGNGGKIYRVSWADTDAGLGGSWGQLGRIALKIEGTNARKCLVIFRTDGSWEIREDEKCDVSR